MKKLAIIASVLVLGATVAMASSLSIPFFRDTGTNLSGGVPTSGFAGFIGIRNNTTRDIVVQVVYNALVNNAFVNSAPATFLLQANASVSWRPVANDPAEGAGQSVPNMTLGSTAGAATLSWTGGSATDIQGRYVEIGGGGFSFAYLLPPGV